MTDNLIQTLEIKVDKHVLERFKSRIQPYYTKKLSDSEITKIVVEKIRKSKIDYSYSLSTENRKRIVNGLIGFIVTKEDDDKIYARTVHWNSLNRAIGKNIHNRKRDRYLG